MRVSAEQLEVLFSLDGVTGRACAECVKLEAKGLVITGRGRFGDWAKLTSDGRSYLARKRAAGGRAASAQVGTAPVEKKPSTRSARSVDGVGTGSQAPDASTLLRGAVPRQRRNTAKNARGTSASIRPPEAVQHVGGTNSKPRGRKKHGA